MVAMAPNTLKQLYPATVCDRAAYLDLYRKGKAKINEDARLAAERGFQFWP
jgi:hypothetical protein